MAGGTDVHEPFDINVTRGLIELEPVTWELQDGNIGHIMINEFSRDVGADVFAAWGEIQTEASGRVNGLVLDLRSNPGGALDEAVARAAWPDRPARWQASMCQASIRSPDVSLFTLASNVPRGANTRRSSFTAFDILVTKGNTCPAVTRSNCPDTTGRSSAVARTQSMLVCCRVL